MPTLCMASPGLGSAAGGQRQGRGGLQPPLPCSVFHQGRTALHCGRGRDQGPTLQPPGQGHGHSGSRADLEPIFFEQLTSERRVVRYFKGQPDPAL